ncbi:OmpA family protein [candidate division WOR-3 bacterium]|nr:OmpA family protein [candidate division WOR-3 bacterium]
MKKLLFIIGIFLGYSLSGAPTSTGTSGLNKIISASPEKLGRLSYSLGIWGYTGKRTEKIGYLIPSDSALPMNRCAILDISLGIGFSFTNYLSLNLNSRYLLDVMETNKEVTGSVCLSYGFSDIELGMKFSPTQAIRLASPGFTKLFDLGVHPVITIPLGDEREDISTTPAINSLFGKSYRFNKGGIHRFFTAGGYTYGGKGLLTINFPTYPSIKVHINGGYMIYPHPDTCNKLSYGAGIEFDYYRFTPFVEVYGEKRVNNIYNDGGFCLSPGLRFETGKNSWITLSMDFKLAGADTNFSSSPPINIQSGFGANPPWAINLAISKGFDFIRPPIEKGIIAGKVVDKATEKPIEAILSFIEFDTTVITDESGYYKIELPVGKTMIQASPLQEGEYEPAPTVAVSIEPDQKNIVNFALERKKVPISILTGRIIDKVTETPCMATISFPETQLPEIRSDISGVYKTELPPGTYAVEVKKTGYATFTQPIVCKIDETTLLNIELIPIERRAILAGKITDYSIHKGILAEIKFPETGLPSIKTDPETGTYKTEIPPGTYTIKVEAEGYTSEGAVIVCEPEATMIKNFTLFKKEEKIVLKGINFASGKATILSSSYPILGHAVELLEEHPTVKIEIAGHTDSVGDDSYNLKLSQLRAEAVRKYLGTHGISYDRLTACGYGKTQPIASNKTKEGRAQNRRIEFRILSK